MKTLFIIIVVSMTLLSITNAQSLSPTVIGSTGGYHEAGGQSLSFTVGEAVTETFSTGSYILTQGFQQPERLIAGIRDIGSLNYFSVSAYPNPTMGKVYIEINSSIDEQIYIQLYDVLGKKIQHPAYGQIINGTYTFVIDLTAFASGLYFVRLINKDGKLIEVLKIQYTM